VNDVNKIAVETCSFISKYASSMSWYPAMSKKFCVNPQVDALRAHRAPPQPMEIQVGSWCLWLKPFSYAYSNKVFYELTQKVVVTVSMSRLERRAASPTCECKAVVDDCGVGPTFA
jgi:hypothetical protein